MSEFWTDVMIHIDETLGDDAIHELERDLARLDGIYSACVNERARHLMLVDFDPSDVKSDDLLWHVEQHGLHAELVGL